jgi:hypothetical protein
MTMEDGQKNIRFTPKIDKETEETATPYQLKLLGFTEDDPIYKAAVERENAKKEGTKKESAEPEGETLVDLLNEQEKSVDSYNTLIKEHEDLEKTHKESTKTKEAEIKTKEQALAGKQPFTFERVKKDIEVTIRNLMSPLEKKGVGIDRIEIHSHGTDSISVAIYFKGTRFMSSVGNPILTMLLSSKDGALKINYSNLKGNKNAEEKIDGEISRIKKGLIDGVKSEIDLGTKGNVVNKLNVEGGRIRVEYEPTEEIRNLRTTYESDKRLYDAKVEEMKEKIKKMKEALEKIKAKIEKKKVETKK